jgi:hypothetical protein
MVIRAYHRVCHDKYAVLVLLFCWAFFVYKTCEKIQARGDHHRNVCIIPVSAHGTNPASAAMCGMKIITVGTDSKGNINIPELKKAAEANKDNLSALMVLFLCSAHMTIYQGFRPQLYSCSSTVHY